MLAHVRNRDTMNLAECINAGEAKRRAGYHICTKEEQFLRECQAEYDRRMKNAAELLQMAEAEAMEPPGV